MRVENLEHRGSRVTGNRSRHFPDNDCSVNSPHYRGRKGSDLPAFPPVAYPAFCRQVGEPIPGENRPYHFGRVSIKWVAPEKLQHAGTAFDQTLLGCDHPWRRHPRLERREPQVPVEARLIGSEESGPLAHVLRLVAERIRDPGSAVSTPLKFDFVSRWRHHRKKSVGIRDPKWIQDASRQREYRHWSSGKERDHCRVKRKAQHSGFDSFAEERA